MEHEADYTHELEQHNAALYAESLVDEVSAQLMENPELSVLSAVEWCLEVDGFSSRFEGLEEFIVEAVSKWL